jgi:hypothetical protein
MNRRPPRPSIPTPAKHRPEAAEKQKAPFAKGAFCFKAPSHNWPTFTPPRRPEIAPPLTDGVLHAPANQIEEVNWVSLVVIAVANLIKVALFAVTLSFPNLAVFGCGSLRLLDDRAQQRDHRLEAIGNNEALRSIVVSGVDRHRRRTGEWLIESMDGIWKVAADYRCERSFTTLIRNGVRKS